MAEIQSSKPQPSASLPSSNAASAPSSQPRGPPLYQIYALPAPIRTFPLPTFYPNNPVSFFHVVYAWLNQLWAPPPAEPSVVHSGTWSPISSSVHVTDDASIRALWEQGFYGKGNLSRSEPNWLRREEVRRGLTQGSVSEILTVQRREERLRAKWERARLEQEAIRQTRLEEAQEAQKGKPVTRHNAAQPTRSPILETEIRPPVSPMALLALPNSDADLVRAALPESDANGQAVEGIVESEVLADPFVNAPVTSSKVPGGIPDDVENTLVEAVTGNGHAKVPGATESPTSSADDSGEASNARRQKNVRFSPNVESTTFKHGDPPSPNHPPTKADVAPNGDVAGQVNTALDELPQLVNKEHLQLTPEEAFFLAFGLGALVVKDADSGRALSNKDLFTLFRQYSYFPPRVEPDDPPLRPDDRFLIHYAVYHHFRSLGWVPRGGIKFGVDWLLYTRGPVFDHAEFGLAIIPSFSDPGWEGCERQHTAKTWQWLHASVRVLSHVMKSLVLVYVDVPSPAKFDEAMQRGFTEVFRLYKVREVMVKRWSANRNR